ncbi:MAG: SDR family oxidoreductase [Gemmatimonadaceae bacterium]|nr:SDR family oxidoreductase [Gemmatimonadaceae bacterium]
MNTTSPTSEGALAGKVALVTGGSRGIGFAIARVLTSHGASAVISGRSSKDLEGAHAELGPRTLAVEADVRDPEDAERLVHDAVGHFGGLDVVVNNAGVGLFGNVEAMSVADWHTIVETNLSGVFYCCRAAIPHLKERGGGWIINVSSLAGSNPFAGGAAYCASKAGLDAFSEALMQEVRHDDIRVSCVAPGSVATGFSRGAGSAADWKIQPEDVAQVVLDLIRMPARSLPSRVELRPSRPRK